MLNDGFRVRAARRRGKAKAWVFARDKPRLKEEGHMKRFISKMFLIPVTTAAVLMMLLAAPPASAQTANPCSKDFAQYCSHVTPGGGRLVGCYEAYKDSMSAACRAWAEGVKANAAVLKEACAKEIDARCNFEKGDPLEMLDCLQGHYVDLSYDCRIKLNEFKVRYPKPVQ
jgi:hypothetical protein